MEKKYVPRELDKRWLRGTINMLNDGGTWGWPAAEIVYQINKRDQIAKMISGDPHCFEAYMGEVVFESIGLTVECSRQGTQR